MYDWTYLGVVTLLLIIICIVARYGSGKWNGWKDDLIRKIGLEGWEYDE